MNDALIEDLLFRMVVALEKIAENIKPEESEESRAQVKGFRGSL